MTCHLAPVTGRGAGMIFTKSGISGSSFEMICCENSHGVQLFKSGQAVFNNAVQKTENKVYALLIIKLKTVYNFSRRTFVLIKF